MALLVASAGFMQNLDGAIINTSLPPMARAFGVSPVTLSLGITAYLLASAAVSPLAHWLSRRLGTRAVLAGSVLVFTLASVGCGLAHGLPVFVLARIAQGVGGALMIPVGTAVVMRHTAPADMLRINAFLVWPALLAPVVGPVLGGLVTETVGWRWNFWLNLPIGLAGAVLMWRTVPDERDPVRRRLDVPGLLLCGSGLACLLAGFQRCAVPGPERAVALALVGTGLALGWAAVRHLRRSPEPLLPLSPLRRPSLRHASLFPGGLFRMVFSTAPFLLPLLFQLGFGLSPAEAGLWVLAYFAGNIGFKPATGAVLRRFGFRSAMLGSGLLVAATLAALAVVGPRTPPAPLLALLVLAGASRSMQLTAVTTLGFADVPGDERGAAANLISMLQAGFSAAGVAFAAFALSLFQSLSGAAVVALPELHAALWLTALLCLAATLGVLSMPRDLGAAVSGHRRRAG